MKDEDEITLHDQLACEKLKVEMLMKKAQSYDLNDALVRLAGKSWSTERAIVWRWDKDTCCLFTALPMNVDGAYKKHIKIGWHNTPTAAVRAALEEKA